VSARFRRPSIAISVDDPNATVRAHSTVEALGGIPRHLSPVQLAQMIDGPVEFVGLIYDLAPWNSSVVPLLGALRQTHHSLPILLYAPRRPEVSSVLLHCADLTSVRVEQQTLDSRGLTRLRDNVRWLVSSVYAEQVTQLVQLLLPDMPPVVLQYVRQTLGRFTESPEVSGLTVGSVVAQMKVPLRTLQHVLEAAGLPSPKALQDWITLLYATLSADAAGSKVNSRGQDLGLDPHRIYRIRRRLLSAETYERCNGKSQEFDVTFLAFADACRVSRGTANTVLDRTA
jgi:hypothetical protein